MTDPASAEPLSLGGEFPQAAREDWLKLVDGVLKGASFDDVLVSKTCDGINIEPLYTRADLTNDFASPLAGLLPKAPADGTPPWQILAPVAHPDPGEANRAILAELAGGATGIVLNVADGTGAPGIAIWTLDDLDRVLGDVRLDVIAVHLRAQRRGPALAALLIELWDRREHAAGQCSGSFGLDPLGVLARTGAVAGGLDGWAGVLADAARYCEDNETGVRALVADGRACHEAGGTPAQELATALASAVDYLRLLEGAGISLEIVARQIRFALSADTDLFAIMAKLRAMRLIWARACTACGLELGNAEIDTETSARMMTTRDPWVNMLRTTAACFAAGAGGAGTITVQPHSAALGNPDAFASRIARNIHLVLQEEAAIGRVRDPAAGSWYVETLTRQMAEKAWASFQDIEREGGMAAALGNGHVQRMITSARDRLSRAIATRTRTLVGVSEFANLGEADIATPDWPKAAEPNEADMLPGVTLDALREAAGVGKAPAFAPSGETIAPPLERLRLATPFEALRDAAARHGETTGTPPQAFLVTLGTPSDFAARARFARDLLAAGGIEAITASEDLNGAGEAARAFGDSAATVAVLCSSDRLYDSLAAETVTALKQAGADAIYLYGKPPGDGELERAGVAARLYSGCDTVDILEQIHTALKVKR